MYDGRVVVSRGRMASGRMGAWWPSHMGSGSNRWWLGLLMAVAASGCVGPSLRDVKEEVRGNVERCMTRASRLAADPDVHALLQSGADVVSQWQHGRPAADVAARLHIEDDGERLEATARAVTEELGALADRIFTEDNMGPEVDGAHTFMVPASVLCDTDLNHIATAFGEWGRFDAERCRRRAEGHTLSAAVRQQDDGYRITFSWDGEATLLQSVFVGADRLEVVFDVERTIELLEQKWNIPDRFAGYEEQLDAEGEGALALELDCSSSRSVRLGLRTVEADTWVHVTQYEWYRWSHSPASWILDESVRVEAAVAGPLLSVDLSPDAARIEVRGEQLELAWVQWWRSNSKERIDKARFMNLQLDATLTVSGLHVAAPHYARIELLDHWGRSVVEIPPGRWPERIRFDREGPRFFIEEGFELPFDFRFENALADEAPPRIFEHSRYILRSDATRTTLDAGPRGILRVLTGGLAFQHESKDDRVFVGGGSCFSLRSDYPRSLERIDEVIRVWPDCW